MFIAVLPILKKLATTESAMFINVSPVLNEVDTNRIRCLLLSRRWGRRWQQHNTMFTDVSPKVNEVGATRN